MASEDQIVNVDGFSSSDDEQNWVDVGADDGLDPSELESGTDGGLDDFSDDGSVDGHSARKGHHNELEKKRRKTLNASYAALKRMLKRLIPGVRVGGRDRCLALAFKHLKKSWKALQSEREKCKKTIETLKEMLAEQPNEAERKEIEREIKKLTELSENKLEIRRLDDEANSDDNDDDNDDDDDSNDDDDEDNNDSDDDDDDDNNDSDDDDDNIDSDDDDDNIDISDEEEHDTDASSPLSDQNEEDEDGPTPCSSPPGIDP